MQIGETVAVVQELIADDKCVICSQKHTDPKKDKIKTVAPGNSGWHRKSMSKVFQSDGVRETIYQSGSFPPSYDHQGHHCIALSSLVQDANAGAPKDRRLRLNFYLDEVGFFPNRGPNCIGLPARKGYGDFKAFFEALDAGKALQMHGPGHDEAYFGLCDRLLSSLLKIITSPTQCKKSAKDEWKDKLKKLMEQGENYAFIQLAANVGGWRLHPKEQKLAIDVYFLPKTSTTTVTGKGGVPETRKGHGAAKKVLKFPSLTLDIGPY